MNRSDAAADPRRDAIATGEPAPDALGSGDCLRRILDAAPVAMVLMGPGGEWLYANRALGTLLGYGREEWVGKSLADALHPDEHDDAWRSIEKWQREDDLSSTLELRHRWVKKDGQSLRVRIHAARLDEARSSSAPAILQIIDVEAQEQELASLKKTGRRRDHAIEAGGIGMFDVDYLADVCHWDARACELHGVNDAEPDQTIEDLYARVHPDDVPKLIRVREQAAGQASRHQVDYRVLQRTSGEIRHLRSAVQLVRGSDGAAIRCIGACWDVTAEIECSKQLHANRALLQAVLEGTPDLIFAKNQEGRYLLANRAVETVMGRPSAEIIGRSDTEIFPPDTAQALIENDRVVHASEAPYMIEESTVVAGTQRTYVSTKSPYRDEHGRAAGLIGISRDITDVKKAEAALRKSEMRWQFALDGAGDGIWDWNIQTGEVFFSHRWKEMLGYSENDVGETVSEWADRVHPDDLPRCWEIVNRHLEGHASDFVLEHRMRAKDGSWRWIYDRGKVIERGADGRPHRAIGTHTDITARKENEAAMLQLNQRLQLAIEAIGAGLFEFDFTTRRCVWDDRMYGLYELPKEGYDGSLKAWLQRVHPDDRPRVRRGYDTAVHETSLFNMDFRIRRQRSGTTHHIRLLARIIRDAAGRPLRATGVNWDINDHKVLAEALYEEKELLRVTLRSIGDGVICTNVHAQITFMNPIAERMTGWPAAEAIGRPLREIFRIVSGESGEALPNPVDICLNQVEPLYLDEDPVLVARENTRCNIRDSAAPVRISTGEVVGAVLVFQDVTKARTMQLALEHSASHDRLTGLPNRMAFEQGLLDAIARTRRGHDESVLCFIDLDRFKIVNDGAGHAAGDALLRDVANLLRRNCRPSDLVARLGGDEFALLLRDCAIEDGEKIAEQFVRAVSHLPFAWDGRSYQIGASAGLTRVAADAPRPDELMTQADSACYAAKAAGRSQISVYRSNGSAAHRHHREIQVAASIRNVIESDRFRLFAQEIRDLRATPSKARHVEVLLRMLDDEGNLVTPSSFIPASERYDLMGTIDRWVIHTVFQGYGSRLLAAPDMSIAINLSANSLNDPFLWPFVQEELNLAQLSPERIHFEITETAIINNLAAAQQFLSIARKAGCRVVLDDFGTGLSSFTYLREFRVDGLKIDGSFIRQMASNSIDKAIVESINAIGHRLGAITVAEQVEDEETLEVVRSIGIDQAQGYAIARPQLFDSLF